MTLEDLKPGASVRGVLPDHQVAVVSTEWFGSDALELTYKTATGKVGNQLLYRAKLMVQAKVSHVFFREAYRDPAGLEVLERAGVVVVHYTRWKDTWR